MFIKPMVSRVMSPSVETRDPESPQPRVPRRGVYRDRISRILPSRDQRDRVSRIFPSRDRVSRMFPGRDQVSRMMPSRDRVSRMFTNYHWTNRMDPPPQNTDRRGGATEDDSDTPGCSLCGVCRVCTCLHYEFLKTPIGVLKLVELILAVFIQYTLAAHNKPEYSGKLGKGYSLLIMVNSSCLLTTTILLLCYNFSHSAFKQIRPSTFEVTFTLVSSLCYAFSSFLLSRRVLSQFFHYFRENPSHEAYPAFTRAYVVGYGIAIVLLLDGILAYRTMKSAQSSN